MITMMRTLVFYINIVILYGAGIMVKKDNIHHIILTNLKAIFTEMMKRKGNQVIVLGKKKVLLIHLIVDIELKKLKL